MKVIVTFFDFYSNYQVLDYTICDRHLEQIIQRIKNHPALLQYDIKNEADLDFKIHGKQKVINWLNFIAERMKHYDKETPITIGWYSPKEATNLRDKVDFISFHYYKTPENFSEVFKELEKQVDKPIVIQEFGKHSYNSIWNLYRNSEKKQAKYHREIQESFHANGVEHFVSWTLYDFPEIDKNVFGRMPHKIGPQKNYGFIDVKGKPKQAIKYISGPPNQKNL
uniref:glycoside hydrolase family 2 TIM barrel-domain containing protein n=1 Tax=Tenacibaculum xiamenense TaxID=1261553 RepID=UPI0038B61447